MGSACLSRHLEVSHAAIARGSVHSIAPTPASAVAAARPTPTRRLRRMERGNGRESGPAKGSLRCRDDAALLSAFDLAVHAVNLREHVFGPGLSLQVGRLAVRVVLNAQFILNSIEHVEDAGDFMLREQPN